MTEVIVRRAVVDDAEDLGRVHVVSWRAAYAGFVPDSLLAGLSVETAVGRWSERLSSDPSGRRIIVAEVDGIVVGFAVVVAGRDGAAPETGELAAIYAEPRVWSQGVGHALHEVALQQLRDLGVSSATLWVLNTNERARRFYERHGWNWVARTRPSSRTACRCPRRSTGEACRDGALHAYGTMTSLPRV